MKKQSVLINTVKEKLAFYRGNIGPATVAPVILIMKASKFEKMTLAAMSIKEQRHCLAQARKALKQGIPEAARSWITSYKVERNCYNLLFR